MKDLLYFCTKHFHFTYGAKFYIHKDGVAMGSPLCTLLVNIFMISLEEAILPSIKKQVEHWKRYVDDTHAYIDPTEIEFVLEKLNSYHPNIQFAHDIEENQKITFLDVVIARTRDDKLEATVFRKEKYRFVYKLELTCTHTMETGIIKESDSKINFDLFQ